MLMIKIQIQIQNGYQIHQITLNSKNKWLYTKTLLAKNKLLYGEKPPFTYLNIL